MEQEHLYYLLHGILSDVTYAQKLTEKGFNEENVQVAVKVVNAVKDLAEEFDKVSKEKEL